MTFSWKPLASRVIGVIEIHLLSMPFEENNCNKTDLRGDRLHPFFQLSQFLLKTNIPQHDVATTMPHLKIMFRVMWSIRFQHIEFEMLTKLFSMYLAQRT